GQRVRKLGFARPAILRFMKRGWTIAIAVAVSAVVVSARLPAQQRGGRALTIEQLLDIKHPSNASWSPDGRKIAFVWDRAGVSAVYVVDTAQGANTSTEPKALPGAGSSLNGAFWSRDSRTLFVSKDGDLWRVPVDGGAASPE